MLFALTLSTFTMSTNTVNGQVQEMDYWAVILCTTGIDGGTKGGPGDAAYAYHVLSTHYAFNDIYYLHYNTTIPEVDAYANSTNFRWAITNWLANKADSNPNSEDIMFIYVIAHGAGIAYRPPDSIPLWGDNLTLYNGHYDENKDEIYSSLNEIQEEHVVNEFGNPVDVNNDSRIRGWVGIDELLRFHDYSRDNMTDDELASDLNTLNGKYKTLIFATQQCMGGGLIDDLSGPNRIIMTAIDETHLAYADWDGDGLSEWTQAFFDALHGEDTSYNAGTGKLIHEGDLINADYNNDGNVSMLEIFNYTSEHMHTVEINIGYPQTVWLDDDGNRLPTYVNETDCGNHCDNGSLACNTWFLRKHCNLTVKTYTTSGSEVSGVKVWIDGSLEYSPIIAHDVTAETHNITVEPTIYLNGYEYRFSFWEDGSTSNPRMLHMHENKTITAYYYVHAQGCPFVSIWNGTKFVIDNNLLANSVTSGGAEVEDYYRLEQNLVPIREHDHSSYYALLLSEFQQEHSYLDQTKLIVADHDSNIKVAVSPFGEILTYQNLNAPVSAIDDESNNHIEEILNIDGSYYEGHNGSYLLLNFGEVDGENAKLVMRADRPPTKWSIHIQVLDAAENWVDVVAIIPRTYWATEIIDLSTYLPNFTTEFKVRLYFTDNHKVDYVGLDTTPQAQITVQNAQLLLAYHSENGKVTTTLLNDDDVYAELTPEQQIILLFSATKQSEKHRTFIIYVKGYYITIP